MTHMRSLILIGHGSHLNPDSAEAVFQYADLVREAGYFDEVIEGYWKEEPSLRQVLRTTRSSDVTVIPMFISEGYFTETVIPRELNLGHHGPVPADGIVRQIGSRTVRYTLPYGVHPAMSEVIWQRALEIYPHIDPADTGLLIIGHGTTRNVNSSRVVYENAERLRQTGHFAQVEALFLDEEPKVNEWESRFSCKNVVMVPFFTAEGWHTQETIPEDLGLSGEITVFPEHTVYYGKPVGTHPLVRDVILQMAQEARGNSVQAGDPDREQLRAWDRVMQLAKEGWRIGEIEIRHIEGLYEIRHALDAGREDLELLISPEGLRRKVRFDEAGEYRPVHTVRNLARGWRGVFAAEDLPRALHYVYPSVIEEAFAHSQHTLHITPWLSTARRQTGIYSKVQDAYPEEVQALSQKLCGGCLKTRLWAGEILQKTCFEGVPAGIPCAEACTLLVAELRDVVSARQKRQRAEQAEQAALLNS